MSDNKVDKGPADRTRVNVHEPYEIEYWSKKFDCSRDELRAAVSKVGVMAIAVEAYLKKNK